MDSTSALRLAHTVPKTFLGKSSQERTRPTHEEFKHVIHLIRGWSFDMINHDDFNRALSRLKLQSKLLLECRK